MDVFEREAACNSTLCSSPPVQYGAPIWSKRCYNVIAMLDTSTDREGTLSGRVPEEGSHMAELAEDGDWKSVLAYCHVKLQKH